MSVGLLTGLNYRQIRPTQEVSPEEQERIRRANLLLGMGANSPVTGLQYPRPRNERRMEDILPRLGKAFVRATLDPIALAARGDVPSGPGEVADYVSSLIPGSGAIKGSMALAGLGIIAGQRAARSNPAALDMARRMKSEGASDEEIWKATGEAFGQPWWLGHPDRVPRFEISDDAYRFAPEGLPFQEYGGRSYRAGKIGQGVEHPELMEAYPSLRSGDLNVYPWEQRGGTRGTYRPEEDFILSGQKISTQPEAVTTWGSETAPSTALHELQHAIQQREGMARGGSAAEFSLNPTTLENYQNILKESQEARRLQVMLTGAGGDEQKAINLFEKRFGAKPSDRVVNKATFNSPEHLESEINAIMGRIADPSGYQQYRRLGGEMEARATQARRYMPMSERINRPFWLDYDEPIDKMILK